MADRKVKKIVLIALMNIFFLAIGLLVGGYVGFVELGKPKESMQNLVAIAMYQQYAQLQYQNADYPEAKEALSDLIALLDEVKNHNDKFINEKTYLVDKTLAYVRLALLEERYGNTKETEEYMSKASKMCKEMSWKDCSKKNIREIVERLDRNYKN